MPYTDEALFKLATEARKNAYAPYSKFKVGAAIIDEKGNIYSGCNVENAAYPLGTCAEVSAINAMVSAGGRRIVKIAVVGGGDKIELCTPCGGCRQAIAEFADDATSIMLQVSDGGVLRYSIADLLPHAFRLKS